MYLRNSPTPNKILKNNDWLLLVYASWVLRSLLLLPLSVETSDFGQIKPTLKNQSCKDEGHFVVKVQYPQKV